MAYSGSEMGSVGGSQMENNFREVGAGDDDMQECYQVIIPPPDKSWYEDICDSPMISILANAMFILLMFYLVVSILETHRGTILVPDVYELMCGFFDSG